MDDEKKMEKQPDEKGAKSKEKLSRREALKRLAKGIAVAGTLGVTAIVTKGQSGCGYGDGYDDFYSDYYQNSYNNSYYNYYNLSYHFYDDYQDYGENYYNYGNNLYYDNY